LKGGGGTFDDFGQGEAWRQHWQGGDAWQLAAGGTLTWHGQGEGSLAWTPALPAAGGLAMRAMVANWTAACQPFGLRLGASVELRASGGQWQLFGPGGGQPVATVAQPAAAVRDLLLLAVEGGVMFWVDGRLVLSHLFAAPVTGVPELFVSGPGGVTALAVLHDAGGQIQFADNAGRVVQEQALDGAAVLVHASLHDPAGRNAVQTSPTRFAGSLFGYRRNFVASFAMLAMLLPTRSTISIWVTPSSRLPAAFCRRSGVRRPTRARVSNIPGICHASRGREECRLEIGARVSWPVLLCNRSGDAPFGHSKAPRGRRR
jgi:hypothetical protein